ncbi:MAG: hypothetical protein WEB87_02290 [Bacteriovoracaceae bacterium]
MLNKKVYIVSICLKKCSRKAGEIDYIFHFRGFYHGQKVQKLLVKGGQFETGEEYLIRAKILGFKQGALICQCLKFKSIFKQ